MRFGLSLPVVQQIPGRAQPWEMAAGGAELLTVARSADRLGFDHIAACDHVAIPRACAATAGTVWYDAAVTLAYLAAATTRVRLLSHVIVLPYRHPLLVAKAFATLDHLSDGRVILGVGCGHLKPEFRTLGVRFEARGALSDEYLQAIRIAWTEAPASFAGQSTQFQDVVVAPRPRQRPHPPIWVGGNSRAAVRRAVRYGDGWIPWMVTPVQFARAVTAARDLAVRVGRGAPLACVAPLAVGAGDEPDAIRAQVRGWRDAGADACHVGLAHTSLSHLLERMAVFAAAVGLPAA